MNYNNAQQRVKDLKSFYKNCMWFGIVAAIIFIRNIVKYADTEDVFRGSMVLMIWGMFLVTKAVKLFILNSDWENKIIEE